MNERFLSRLTCYMQFSSELEWSNKNTVRPGHASQDTDMWASPSLLDPGQQHQTLELNS